jgi:hypothetical protein
VNQTVHQPLPIHFALASKRKSIQFARVADVTEYRLDDAEPAAVFESTQGAVDLAFHLIQEFLWPIHREAAEEYDLSVRCALWISQALGSQHAISTGTMTASELRSDPSIDHDIGAVAMQSLARRANAMTQVRSRRSSHRSVQGVLERTGKHLPIKTHRQHLRLTIVAPRTAPAFSALRHPWRA